MTDNFSIPKWSARNPLGIIALFISLIYGMSALLLGASVKSLAATNQTLLVIFIVVFPFVVLGLFGWLVARHHKKLYWPGDFRSDEGFLKSEDALPPSALGHRLQDEIENSTDAGKNGQGLPSPEGRKLRPMAVRLAKDQQSQVAEAYIAESLVFQELQNELGGAVKRGVGLRLSGGRRIEVDGVIQTDRETVIVEVKFVGGASALARLVANYGPRLANYREAFAEQNMTNVRFILAFVRYETLAEQHADEIIRKYRDLLNAGVTVKVYSYEELLRKYSLIPSAPKPN